MQALFGQRYFKRLIRDVDLSRADLDASRELRLLARLQRLFRAMENRDLNGVDLLRTIRSVYDSDGRRIFRGHQEDVHIYYGHLMRMLEEAWRQLPNERPDALVDVILGARQHYSEAADVIEVGEGRPYSISPLSLHLHHETFQKAVKDAFTTHMDDLRRGGRLVRGVVRSQIVSLPRHLNIQLLRMEAGYDHHAPGQDHKINDAFPFPRRFALGDFVGCDANGNDSYLLRAVILHTGTLRSGHYTAVVRRDDQWLLYNDSHVKAIEESELSWRAFGHDRNPENAYMLFYDRESPTEATDRQ